VFRYAFAEFWLARLPLATARLLLTTHLDVLPPFPYVEIVRICSLTFVSYLDMHLLVWLLWFVATLEQKEESLLRPFAEAFRPGFVSGLFMCGCAHQSRTRLIRTMQDSSYLHTGFHIGLRQSNSED
jgi:hypothetical protein